MTAELALRIASAVVGVVLIAVTLASATRTTVLPRGYPSRLGRAVFLSLRVVLRIRLGRSPAYERRDRVMALFAPLGLLLLLVTWLALIVLGFSALYWSFGGISFLEALRLSGSAVTTLGSEHIQSTVPSFLTDIEAAIGLILLALLITYLPSIYSAFSRRERLVTSLEVRAGAPPSGYEMLWRFWVLGRMDRLVDVWERWEDWFVELEESHTSFPALTFFRSPQPDHSWVTAAGAVLDGASLLASTIDVGRDVQAEITIRAGYLALRRIASFFQLPFDPDPRADDPISVTREEYDAACERLAEAGVALKPDREQAWRDFSGWRVNYDAVLLGLANLTIAPEAPWSSDRAGGRPHRPPIFRQGGRAVVVDRQLEDRS
jgi:hypothetical protein